MFRIQSRFQHWMGVRGIMKNQFPLKETAHLTRENVCNIGRGAGVNKKSKKSRLVRAYVLKSVFRYRSQFFIIGCYTRSTPNITPCRPAPVDLGSRPAPVDLGSRPGETLQVDRCTRAPVDLGSLSRPTPGRIQAEST